MKRVMSMLLGIAILLSIMSGCASESTKVSDSQIEYDIPNLVEYLDDEEDFPSTSIFDHWEVAQHTYNKEMHSDTVQLNLYYSTWLATDKYTVNLVYQYSRDNDLWTLIDRNGAEHVDTEFSSDLPDKLEGRTVQITKKLGGLLYINTNCTAAVTIQNVDLNADIIEFEYSVMQQTKGYDSTTEVYTIEKELSLWHSYYNLWFSMPFDYTLLRNYTYEPKTKEGSVIVKIYEDSIDVSILD